MNTFISKPHLFINFCPKTFFFIFFVNQANEDLSAATTLACTISTAADLPSVS